MVQVRINSKTEEEVNLFINQFIFKIKDPLINNKDNLEDRARIQEAVDLNKWILLWVWKIRVINSIRWIIQVDSIWILISSPISNNNRRSHSSINFPNLINHRLTISNQSRISPLSISPIKITQVVWFIMTSVSLKPPLKIINLSISLDKITKSSVLIILFSLFNKLHKIFYQF